MPAVPVPDQKNNSRQILNRRVWVVNRGEMPYTEDFRGETITVPPNMEKAVKMPYLKAERFLAQMPSVPPIKLETGQWTTPPKALKIIEMTDEERGHKLPEPSRENLSCVLCGFEALDQEYLDKHLSTSHPEHG